MRGRTNLNMEDLGGLEVQPSAYYKAYYGVGR